MPAARRAVCNVWVVTKREFRAYFGSPAAYLVAALLLGLTGYYFVSSVSAPFAEASAAGYLAPTARVVGLWVPLLTMRLLAEEAKLGTLELLQTAPVADWQVVAGKFLASVGMLIGTLVLTLLYVVLLFWFGSPDPGPLAAGYLGLVLYGGAALAIGIFASSLTSNQLVAAGIALSVLFFLTIADQAAEVISGLPAEILIGISFSEHYADFAVGIIDASRIAYFGTLTLFFLTLTTVVLGSRRWR